MAVKLVLDTRFYFSYYNPENEEVASWSRELVRGAWRKEVKAVSSTITITELLSTMGRVVGIDAVKTRISYLKSWNIEFIPLSDSLAQAAGQIILGSPTTPIADAIIAATALECGGVVVTDDVHFKGVKSIKIKWLT